MQLIEYNTRYESDILHYYLSMEQLEFTGTPSESIELSKRDKDRHSILAIENNELVTFFVLHRNEGVKPYSNNGSAILLRGFSTDYRHQGKGYAKKSLIMLPAFIQSKFPDINQIVLAVNVRNAAAQTLYKKCGFRDEGDRRMGRKGELVIMNYYL